TGIGGAPWQSLVMEVSALEQPDGEFDTGELAALSVAASTGRTAYAFRYEFDDVEGVPDWAAIAANRVERRNGTTFGSAIEWRGGEEQSFDVTLALSTRLTGALLGSIVLEDVLASDVDGVDGSRRWRGGVALRPPGGEMFLAWDYDRLESLDEGRHWFALGMDRGAKYEFLVATNDLGEWSFRAGIRLGPARWGGAYLDPDGGPAIAVASIEVMGDPVVR
ncbi:hypothetical protein K8I85_14620, partial [bacterium]|nr:hypothetical protein [bacterium]